MTPKPADPEAQAAARYWMINAVRIGSLAAVILGIAIAREVIALPYFLGVALAIAGLLAFFFAPPILAKRWASRSNESDR